MSDGKSSRTIRPPNRLKRKIGAKMPKLNADMVAKAEASLEALSDQFSEWIIDEVAKLNAAAATVKDEGLMGEAGTALYRVAHDLKGLGATYGFPLVSRLAGSLCRLMDTDALRGIAPLPLVHAHVAAIAAAVREQTKNAEKPVAAMLANELEQQVATIVKKAA